MSTATRKRLAKVVRWPDVDLAELALLVCAEAEPTIDVDIALLRVDALADGLRAAGFRAGEPEADADALTRYLAVEQGFEGTEERTPDAALLTHVLDNKRGLPVALTMLYVAIARRLRIPAFPIGLPGRVVTGIGGGDRPVVVDPSRGGVRLDQAAIAAQVEEATSGQLSFRRSMLRASPTPNVVRRLLNELAAAYTLQGRSADALWVTELKLLLPNRLPDDHRVQGDLLVQVGRYDVAAAAYEAYLEATAGAATDDDEVRRAIIRARARMN
jgi:regulator of sirC expression with transglutaminase-like and TPR domain